MIEDRSGCPAPSEEERNIRLLIEYDGSGFAGWQVQPGQRTVQGAVEGALEVLCKHSVRLQVAGRTDAGVHAWGQVANFRTHSTLKPYRLAKGINALAGDGVRVAGVEEVPPAFDARHSSRAKHYTYRVLARTHPSALLVGRVWHVAQPLDRGRMERELASLQGEADWSAYRASDCSNPSPIKTMYRAELVEEEHSVLALCFAGSGFLKYMVRTLVGTTIEVGLGQRPEGDLLRVRATGDRGQAGRTAPAEGLYLERVDYGDVSRGD